MTRLNSTPPKDLCQLLDELVHAMVESGVELSFARLSLEKTYISEVLRRNQNNIGQSASALGMHRNTLSKRIRDLQIQL